MCQVLDSIFGCRFIVLTTVDQVMQVRIKVLNLLAELLDVLGCIFVIFLTVVVLPAAIVIFLCNLVKHAYLSIQLLYRILVVLAV